MAFELGFACRDDDSAQPLAARRLQGGNLQVQRIFLESDSQLIQGFFLS